MSIAVSLSVSIIEDVAVEDVRVPDAEMEGNGGEWGDVHGRKHSSALIELLLSRFAAPAFETSVGGDCISTGDDVGR